MKKRLLSLALALSMCLTMVPTGALAAEVQESPVCICETKCAPGEANPDCPVCSAADADLDVLCLGVTEQPQAEDESEPNEAPTEESTEAPTEKPTEAPTEEPTEAPTEKPTENTTPTVDEAAAAVQAMIDALPTAEDIAAMEDDGKQRVFDALTAIDDAMALLTEEQCAALDQAKYEAAYLALMAGIMLMDEVDVASVEVAGATTNYASFTEAWAAAIGAGISEASPATITLLADANTNTTGLLTVPRGIPISF